MDKDKKAYWDKKIGKQFIVNCICELLNEGYSEDEVISKLREGIRGTIGKNVYIAIDEEFQDTLVYLTESVNLRLGL